MKATTPAYTCHHCQPSRRRFRVVFFGRRPLPTTLLQIMQPTTPPQARNRLSPGTIKCTHSLLGFEDPLPSECSGPPCIGANPIRQVRMPPHVRLTRPFVRDLHTGLDSLQPTRRMASPARSPPSTHLQTGACSGDRNISDLNRGPSGTQSQSLVGDEQWPWNIQDLTTLVGAPMSNCLCACACPSANNITSLSNCLDV